MEAVSQGKGVALPTLKERLVKGECLFGPFVKLSSPQTTEIAGFAGFDFVILDTEHGPLTFESIMEITCAAQRVGIAPLARIYDNSPSLISRALDVGVQGIIVPQITSKAEAEQLAKASRFWPMGERGVCRFVRAADYSAMDRFEYMEKANREVLVVAIIESKKGLECIDDVISVPGIDVVFIGPYDLSQSLGVPGQIKHEKVLEAMKGAVEKARKAGGFVGTFTDSIEDAKYWMNAGVQFISYSVDVGIMLEAMKSIVVKLKA